MARSLLQRAKSLSFSDRQIVALVGANAAVLGIKARREKGLSLCPLQEYHEELRGK